MGLERIELPSSALEADILPVYYRPFNNPRNTLFFNLSNAIILINRSNIKYHAKGIK